MPEQLESPSIDLILSPSTSDLSAFAADTEMVAEFVIEAREHLANVEERLLMMEKNSSDLEAINAVFRAVHTIKGLAGFLELQAIQDVAHEVETLLDHARTRRLVITPPLVDSLFQGIDFIRSQVEGMHSHLSGGSAPPLAANSALMLHLREIAIGVASGHGADESKPLDNHLPIEAVQTASDVLYTEGPDGPSLVGQPLETTNQRVSSPPRAAGASANTSSTDDSSIRIETSKLDHLMDMVGELVIANTIANHNPNLTASHDQHLIAGLALLTRITAEVQRITTSMRMVPVGTQFQKTARLVRDLSRQLGKQIAMVTSGEDTEVDKTIAEALADPLMHMVRNSIDHGIESAAERLAAGKEAVAEIRLSAYHQSAQVVIEIADDGRGLDRDRILQKATERGLVAPGTQLSDSDVFQLIFEPGFSTAEKVTGISGRGVGMDVVRRHVQKLRGRIDIQSEPGVGTTFFLRLPLTLALIEGLVVAVGEDRYIVPLYSASEIFCPGESEIQAHGTAAETVTVRGADLPVVRLYKSFNLRPRSEDLTEGILIVTGSENRRFCLFVDEMLGKQELVVKNLGDAFKEIAGLMGCAILSDGRVGLILDVEGIMP